MRAVNLIPVEERRGSAGGAGKTGGAVYVILGGLALLVVVVAALTLAGRTVSDRKTELAGLQEQVRAEQARTAQLQAYTAFRTLREKRVQTVTSLAASRFDWGAALHEVSRVAPKNVWLTQLTATAAPGVSVGGSGGASGNLRSALPTPAIEITGCTTSQPAVARTMAAMRRIDGVTRVALASSEKADIGAAGGAGGGGGGVGSTDCRQGKSKFPQFSMVIFFDAPAGAIATTPGAVPAVATTAAPTGPSGTAAVPSSGTTPVTQQEAGK